MNPESLNDFFPVKRQRHYVSILQKREGLTKRRAECFVRIWAYLLLKWDEEVEGNLPSLLTRLYTLEEAVPCTLREATAVFYSPDRGSERAAGLMLDQLVTLGLIDKEFDGQSLCLRIRSLPELITFSKLVTFSNAEETIELYTDAFNPRTDAVLVANLLTQSHVELFRHSRDPALKVVKALRLWSKQYALGMRVLRRSDNDNVVGAYVLYPVTNGSEENFFRPPSDSFYLSTDQEVDPFEMAAPGDTSCISVYVRIWVMAPSVLNIPVLSQFLMDMQRTLEEMQRDYPEICDLYALIVHPRHREIQQTLQFEVLYQESHSSYAWMYTSIDRFLQTPVSEALARFEAESNLDSNLL